MRNGLGSGGARRIPSTNPVLLSDAASIASSTTALRKLSAQLGAADGLLASLEDSDARIQMIHAQAIARKSLIRAMNELSQAIKKWPC